MGTSNMVSVDAATVLDFAEHVLDAVIAGMPPAYTASPR